MKIIIVISIITLLTGCATSYQPQGMTGGFSETQLDQNVFTVLFKGNGFTSKEKAKDFTLLRSAELALNNGYKYFVIVDADEYSENSTYTTPMTATTDVNANTYGTAYNYGNTTTYNANIYGTATTTISGGETYNISRPRSSNTIVCFKDKPQGFVYNAELISSSLKKKHGINNGS